MKANGKLTAALAFSTLALAGCYVVPAVGPDGQPIYHAYPIPPGPPPPGAYPVVLQARLYPDNDLATQTGVVSGTVTNMMTGKGRFQLQYGGEVLTGEATRVDGDSRRGIASAYGSGGAYMSCEYQMNNPRQGAGTCLFSNGARYKVHIGS
ncbi:MAG: hypothetical protein AB1452_06765 [Pseudomonadota bacterium]